MTDEELIARLRVQRTTDEMTTEECAGADYEYAYNMVVQDCHAAADRIEALVKQVDTMLTPEEAEKLVEMADPILSELLAVEAAYRKEAEAKVEKLRGVLRGRIHWIDGEDHCDCGECEALVTALSATTEEGHE